MNAAAILVLLLLFLLIRMRERYSQPNVNYFTASKGDRTCGDLEYTKGPDLEQCKAKCDAMDNCIGISWHPDGHCWQKGSAGNKHCTSPLSMGHHLNGYQFYYRQTPGFFVEGEGDRPGGDIRVINNVGLKQCAEEAKKDNDSIGFSYNSVSRTCIPKRQSGIWGHFAQNGWQFYNKVANGGQPGETQHFQKWTPPNDWGGGNTIFLDRHHVDCETGALRSFHLYRPKTNQIAYEYVCQKDWEGKGRQAKDTGWNVESSAAIFLDRHDVTCGDFPIRDFRLVRSGNGKFRYDYGCSDKKHGGACRKETTPWNDENPGAFANIYLDRHHPDCGNDVMTRFKLQRDGNGKYQYQYTCCKK